MNIVRDFPPNIDAIKAVFPIRGRGVIFAYGSTIYNPEGRPVPPHLLAHEAVHGKRQGDDIDGWWEQYLTDPTFRLTEEVAAHVAEYRHIIGIGNRAEKRKALASIAARLAGPLYGRIITLNEAKALLRQSED